MEKNKLTEAEKMLMQKNQEYWGRRLEAVLYKREEVARKGLDKELKKLYRQANRKIEKHIQELYLELLEGGEVKLSSLYEKNRLEKLKKNISKELKVLGKAESKAIEKTLIEAYQLAFTDVAGELGTEFAQVNTEVAKEIIHTAWSGDDFSDLIWNNKKKLLKLLEDTLKNSVLLGYSKDKAVKEIEKAMGVGFNQADRIVRTEVMHTLNEACSNVAKERGYKRKRVLAEIDERTCSVCKKLDGDIVPIDAHVIPAHCNCRCTYTIIIEDLLN